MKFFNHLEEPTTFEGYYNEVRKLEGRLLSLEQIKRLPQTAKDYQHHEEWNLRISSTERILNYLAQKKDFSLLDLGCGNGWFLYKLKDMAKTLCGVDINLLELNQARELLENVSGLSLHYGDIFDISLEEPFDFIILNGCAQYFPSLKALLDRLLPMLSDLGEIHIVDSPFYHSTEAAQEAKTRSAQYYEDKVADMAGYYHHHTLQDLKDHEHQVMYNPVSIKRKLLNRISRDSPLYWIKVIQKKN